MRLRTAAWTVFWIVVMVAFVALFAMLPASEAGTIFLSELVIFLVAAYLTYKVWLFAFLRRKAEQKIVVRNIDEGTGSLVLQNREAVRFLTAKADTDPDKKWNLIHGNENKDIQSTGVPKEKELRKFSALEDKIDRFLPGGMRWVGFGFMGYELLEYNFRWEVLRSSHPGDGKDGRPHEDSLVDVRDLKNGKWVASFAKRIDYIYLRDAVYYFETTGAETKGRIVKDDKGNGVPVPGMPVDIRCEITLRVVNPYLALIDIHDWLESIFGLLRPSMRGWIASRYYEEIQGKLEVSQREYDEFLNSTGIPEEALQKLRDKGVTEEVMPKNLREYIEYRYGIRIKRIGFDDIVPPKNYADETIARAAAEQRKVRIEVEASAERSRLTIVAEGEAARLTTVAAAMNNDTVRELRRLEAMEEVSRGSGSTIVLSGENANLLLNAPPKGGSK